MVAIKVKFDGKVFVPEEPVSLPAGQQLIVHLDVIDDSGTAAATARRLAQDAPWSGRTEIGDSSEFARQLRADVEARRR